MISHVPFISHRIDFSRYSLFSSVHDLIINLTEMILI